MELAGYAHAKACGPPRAALRLRARFTHKMLPFPLALERDYITVLKHIRPPRPDSATLWWMLGTVLGAVAVFVAFELVSRLMRMRRATRKSRDDFNQLSLVCQLTPEEIRLLNRLILVCEVKYPDRFFTSFEFFNRCLEEHGPHASGELSEADMQGLRIIRNKIFFGERSKLPPVKTTYELRPNQWLYLKRKANGRVFLAPVVEAGETGLLVATPKVQSQYLEAGPGERFEIYFWRDRDASYHFESEVLGQTGAHLLITIFKHVEDVQRVQRRQYHRVEMSVPVVATPVTRDELDRISANEPLTDVQRPGLHAHVVNLSGAGFALAARVELSPNDLVYFEIPADRDNSAVPLIGKVLDVSERKHTGEFVMRGEFVGLSAETQEKLFRFIYSQAPEGALPAA